MINKKSKVQSEDSLREMFDEVPIKIKRSHLMQAFLAEYVYPQLPSYSSWIDEDMNMTNILEYDL